MNITDLITIIRNAVKTNKNKIIVPSSKKINPFLEILCEEGYIAGYTKVSSLKTAIFFNYTYKKSKILIFKHVSKPSRPVYISYQDLWKFNKSLSTLILSTSYGIISHRTALIRLCGGKVLCILM
jgi:small subunit ribosomal protein S8